MKWNAPHNIARMLAIIALWLPVASPCRAQAPKAAEPIVSDRASFAEPEGWVRMPGSRPKTKGWFVPRGSTGPEPRVGIMVDIGKPTLADARKTAEAMAKSWGGQVLDEPTTLDGVEAFRVRAEPKGDRFLPVEGVVTIKDGKLYLLMGGAAKGHSVIDKVEEVRKGWKWIK